MLYNPQRNLFGCTIPAYCPLHGTAPVQLMIAGTGELLLHSYTHRYDPTPSAFVNDPVYMYHQCPLMSEVLNLVHQSTTTSICIHELILSDVSDII